MKRRRAKVTSIKRRKPKLENGEIAEGMRRLALTGAIVPEGYNVHKNQYDRTKPLQRENAICGSDHESRPNAAAIPLDRIAAGAVGKRPATWAEVKAIAAGVRVGADVSSFVAAILLTEPQRETIREANRQYTSQLSGPKSKLKRWRNRGAQDIFRRGIRVSGSYQSSC